MLVLLTDCKEISNYGCCNVLSVYMYIYYIYIHIHMSTKKYGNLIRLYKPELYRGRVPHNNNPKPATLNPL